MKSTKAILLLVVVSAGVIAIGQTSSSLQDRARKALAQTSGRIELRGLQRPVEVIRDRWGVPHIYAENDRDLFFAQGYVVAQDRLWQLEMWRRNGEGRLAEIVGERALERDRFARLLAYRGDMDAEWSSYAPDAKQIITSFTEGINAYIAEVNASGRLPIEFELMGFRPEPWKPEVCLTRLAGYIMTHNSPTEVLRAAMAARLGPEKTMELLPVDPNTKIRAEPGLSFNLFTLPTAMNILSGHRAVTSAVPLPGESIGSNNWTISGAHTATGRPILANDPHRPLPLPALRYMAHLVSPGWNVIGAGEPALPAVAIGHNGRIAYGFTIFATDQQDIFVERTHPRNLKRYQYRGAWHDMKVVMDQIHVKGRAAPETVELTYTRHGPVIYQDRKNHVAYALRWAGHEPGGAGYLGAISLIRAKNWNEFQSALKRSWKSPGQNVVYADVEGNIGYQAAGLSPVRERWNGLVPVPGHTGRYEWRGYYPLEKLPRAFNPAAGYVATANHRTIAVGGGAIPPVGYEWAAPYRFQRADQVLSAAVRSGRKLTIEDSQRLQHDEVSLPAQEFVPMLRDLNPDDPALRAALQLFDGWDYNLSAASGAAALYEVFIHKLFTRVLRPRVPEELWTMYTSRATFVAVMRFLDQPPGRREHLLGALREAIAELNQKLGANPKQWRWGDLHKAEFRHPLAAEFSLPPVERGGDAYTVNNTNPSERTWRQSTGASYRQIFDVGNWDNSVAVSVPGQSGQPGSPHYGDLLPLWSAGQYHPLPYSRGAVEKYASQKLMLVPAR